MSDIGARVTAFGGAAIFYSGSIFFEVLHLPNKVVERAFPNSEYGSMRDGARELRTLGRAYLGMVVSKNPEEQLWEMRREFRRNQEAANNPELDSLILLASKEHDNP